MAEPRPAPTSPPPNTVSDRAALDRALAEIERRDQEGYTWPEVDLPIQLPTDPPSRRPPRSNWIKAIVITTALAVTGAIWLAIPTRQLAPQDADLTPRGDHTIADQLTPRGDHTVDQRPVTLTAFVHRDGRLIDLTLTPPHTLRPGDLLSVRVNSQDPDRTWALLWLEDDTGTRQLLTPHAIAVAPDGTWSGPTAPFTIDHLVGPGRIVAVFLPFQTTSAHLDLIIPDAQSHRTIIVRFP